MINLPIEFSDKKVTPFGGMSLMKHFLDSIKIEDKLRQLELPQGHSNRAYDPVQIIQSFWLSIWTGASRYIHTDWLRYDKVLQEIFDFKQMPSQSTYGRFFNKFFLAKNTQIFPQRSSMLMDMVNIQDITLDLDSTIITRSGNQQGSAKGYNPLKKGATLTIRLLHLSHKLEQWLMLDCVLATLQTIAATKRFYLKH